MDSYMSDVVPRQPFADLVLPGDDPNDPVPDMSDIARFQEEDEAGDGFRIPEEVCMPKEPCQRAPWHSK